MELRRIIELTAEEIAARHALVEAHRELCQKGLNGISAGSMSCRFQGKILITPAGAWDESIDDGMFPLLDVNDSAVESGVPCCEWLVHAEIYNRKPAAMAIAHVHGDACVALSSLRCSIPAFHHKVAEFGGNAVPCASFAPSGTPELARVVAQTLTNRTACLLANHGLICCGTTLKEVMAAALTVETLARQYLLALQAGTPFLLTGVEISVAALA